jgi:acyl transferase domain-containing protein/aryl carrier-like protein
MAEAMAAATGSEVAVIGMAGRFPGAKNIHDFWENLKNGVESVSFVSDEEIKNLDVDANLHIDSNYVKVKGGVLEDRELFDASFFGFTPKEAEIMDPQIRIYHECVWSALEDAGYIPEKYNGSIGLYAGARDNVYWVNLTALSGKCEELGYFASRHLNNKDFISTQIAYKLNLKGPCFTVQTACSTSLVAIHLACQGILNGECNMALAGGIRIGPKKRSGYIYQDGMINSPDGHCRAFDAKAKGTIQGEGSGVVLLKPLEDAITDGDHIYAIIKGTAVNNDGLRKVGYTAPSIQGQADVIHVAQQVAEVEPETITYVEAHGTATQLGDPVEIEALKLAFNTGKKNYCAIGSIKTNIGHLDTAAGVAGFIKTVLALKHRVIPPSLHFESPNPGIDFKNSPFYVNNRLTEWKSNGYPRRAAVSSFGIGGTNAHAILEEWPDVQSPGRGAQGQQQECRGGSPCPPPGSREHQLILLSAKTKTALETMTRNLADNLKENPCINLADAAYTLQSGRKEFQHRKMIVSAGVEEAIAGLSGTAPENVKTFSTIEENLPVVFMFPGQGSQYLNMGHDLYEAEPIFREEIDRCSEILKPLMDCDIKEILYPSPVAENKPDINQTEIAQVTIFVFEYSLAKLLMALGIKPYAMIGHSIGEYTAACLSGVLSLEDALKAVVSRGNLMQKMAPGSMLSIPLPGDELKPLLETGISLAAVNSSSRCAVSGNSKSIQSFKNKLDEMGHESTFLHTSHAFHSAMMEPILNEFKDQISKIKLNEPQIPYISNVTGTWITSSETTDTGYWSGHIRNTVRFAEGIEILLAKEHSIFLEVGPGEALSTFVRQHKDKNANHFVINAVRHPREQVTDDYFLLSKIGQLWLYGVNIHWDKFYPDRKRRRLPLPSYPFERQYYWINEELLNNIGKGVIPNQAINKNKDITDWFYVPSWKRSPFPVKKEIAGPEQSAWLVFMDNRGVGDELIKQLEEDKQGIVGVQTGPAFAKIKENRFIINPKDNNDYIKLFDELKKDKRIPDRIIHLWGLMDGNIKKYTPVSLEKSFELSLYSLLYLAQAIGKDITANIKIEIVTTHLHEINGEEELCPEKAAVLGPSNTIPQEYPNISCRCIDIVLPASKKTGESGPVKQLLREITANNTDKVVAHRNNHRWVQVFEPLKLEESLEKKGKLKLKQGGVYLITGGLGAVGFIFAGYLAKEFHTKLILTGVSKFPPREKWDRWQADKGEEDPISIKIRKTRELEEMGGEVLIFSADVVNEKQMEEVIRQSEREFGKLNGVIYAAGVVGGPSICPIENLDKARCNMQLSPKLYGLPVLERLLEKKELDFCLLTSSASSILGGLGFLAYSTANILMDSYTHYHNQGSPSRWLTVNWDGWEVSKRRDSRETLGEIGETQSHLAIEPAEGVKALLRILSCDDTHQVVNSTGDLELRLNRWIRLESLQRKDDIDEELPGTAQARPNLTTPYVAPGNELERNICDVWKKLFGFELIGINDDFFELGGDSLRAINLVGHLRKIGGYIALIDVVSNPTIHKLAILITEKNKARELMAEVHEEQLLSQLECIERLNKGRNKKNIFILHPRHGMTYQYKELAKELEAHYNVYGIRARGLMPDTKMSESPGQMIKDYIEQILKVQPQGPFIIAGFCSGAMIAYPIILDLEKQNHHVERYILFDGRVIFSSLYVTILNLLEYLPGFVKKFIHFIYKKRYLKEKSKTELIDNENQMNEEVELPGLPGVRVNKKFGDQIFLRCKNIIPLGIIKAPILSLRAEISLHSAFTEQDYCRMTKSSATLINIPGDHDSIFSKPYVERLAEALKDNV